MLLLNTWRLPVAFEVDLSALPLEAAEEEWFRIYNTTMDMLERRARGTRLLIGSAIVSRALPDRAFAVPAWDAAGHRR